jgi:hypothetical protein
VEDVADDYIASFYELGDNSLAFDGQNSETGLNIIARHDATVGKIHQFETVAAQAFGEAESRMKTAAGLGSVEIHLELMMAEQRWIIAEKH